MLKHEAEALLDTLVDAYEKQLSDRFRGFYLARLMECEHSCAVRAADKIVDVERTFPRWATFRLHYDPELATQRELYRKAEEKKAELPMTPAELVEVAQEMAFCAADRRRAGRADAITLLLEHGAEVYSENAKRRAVGEPSLPVPRIDDAIRELAAARRF